MMMLLDAMHFRVHKWWEVVAFASTYTSSQKSAHGARLPKMGMGALSVFLHITTEECLCRVYSDLI